MFRSHIAASTLLLICELHFWSASGCHANVMDATRWWVPIGFSASAKMLHPTYDHLVRYNYRRWSSGLCLVYQRARRLSCRLPLQWPGDLGSTLSLPIALCLYPLAWSRRYRMNVWILPSGTQVWQLFRDQVLQWLWIVCSDFFLFIFTYRLNGQPSISSAGRTIRSFISVHANTVHVVRCIKSQTRNDEYCCSSSRYSYITPTANEETVHLDNAREQYKGRATYTSKRNYDNRGCGYKPQRNPRRNTIMKQKVQNSYISGQRTTYADNVS